MRVPFFLACVLLAACAGPGAPAPAPTIGPAARPATIVDDPFDAPGPVVLVFVRTDCPIANRYAPTLAALAAEHTARGTRFVLVYPDADATPAVIDGHRREYALAIDALRDPGHRWVERAGVTTTPEAAVYDRERRLVYRGRIDDRFATFGVARNEPRERDLDTALDRLEAGERLEFTTRPALGCPIPSLD